MREEGFVKTDEAVSMLKALDQLLLKHLERITGMKEGIQGLPLSLTTIACIVMLAEREEEVGDSEDSLARYDGDELVAELESMGLKDPAGFDALMGLLADKGYMEMDANGRIKLGGPCHSMARLMEHAFHGIPGLNLVAYFVQTMDEVESGRKSLPHALMQLDQILRRHGAAPFKQTGSRTAASSPAGISVRPQPRAAPSVETPTFVSPALARAQKTGSPTGMENMEPEEKTAPSEGLPNPAEPPPTRESPGHDVPEASSPEPPASEEAFEAPTEADEGPGAFEVVSTVPGEAGEIDTREDDLPAPAEEEARSEEPGPEETSGEGIEGHENALLDGDELEDFDEGEQGVDTPPEVSVEERIAAFEEGLTLQCPVCLKAAVRVRETVKGRLYYTCSDEKCSFISWGKPYHLECPRCGNPFLIEYTSRDGKALLKCPRATCGYKRALDPAGSGTAKKVRRVRRPRRRVVRKKVVRRG